jgi:hypothetical protein
MVLLLFLGCAAAGRVAVVVVGRRERENGRLHPRRLPQLPVNFDCSCCWPMAPGWMWRSGWLLGSMVAALAAWDLDGYYKRLRRVPHIEQEAQIVQHSFAPLVGGLGISLLIERGCPAAAI